MQDIIILAALGLILGGAARYLWKAKRAGQACIGCSGGACCGCKGGAK